MHLGDDVRLRIELQTERLIGLRYSEVLHSKKSGHECVRPLSPTTKDRSLQRPSLRTSSPACSCEDLWGLQKLETACTHRRLHGQIQLLNVESGQSDSQLRNVTAPHGLGQRN